MANDFWVVDIRTTLSQYAYGEPQGARYGEAPRCGDCGRYIGPRAWLPPYRLRLRKGTRTSEPGDMITGPGFEPFVASERFRSEWTSSALKGIIGWTPVEIVGRKELKYYFPEFQPRMVKANLNAMNVSWQGAFSPCKSCGQATIAEYRGIKLQQETWTGQDLFLLTNLPDVIATTGFKQLVDDKRLSNIDLVPLGEYVPVFAR